MQLIHVAALVVWLTILVWMRATPVRTESLLRAPIRLRRLIGELFAIGPLIGAAVLAGAWAWMATHTPTIVDSRVYWAVDTASLYSGTVNEIGSYLYTPVMAFLLDPLGALPWPVFYALWVGASLLLLAWMVGPLAAALTLAFPPVHKAIWIGNIDLMLAASVVLAVRFPAAWAFPLLTKITPGVGILWHVGRRDWQGVAIAAGVTLVLSLASFVVAPQLWFDWFGVLAASTSVEVPGTLLPWPLEGRVLLAMIVSTFAGLAGSPWLIPFALVISQPIFWTAGVTILVAVVPLSRLRMGSRATAAGDARTIDHQQHGGKHQRATPEFYRTP